MADEPPREWLEADGLGGFASGTATGIRTRRYHAILLTAQTPPTGRLVLVNGLDAFVETTAGRVALSSQRYAPGVVAPDGASRVESFEASPWPRWIFALPGGTRIAQELFVPKGASVAALSWRRLEGAGAARLEVRPFFSGRDYHALHHENAAFRFEPEAAPRGGLVFRPYAGVPAVRVRTNGSFEPARDWYRNFLYEEERNRGLDFLEDLASPALFRFDLEAREAVWLAAAEGPDAIPSSGDAAEILETLRASERRRRLSLPGRLERAADAYLVSRGRGRTIVAGYPWFTDWGRDSFIALRGLCLATRRFAEAESILLQWAESVSEGMLPNFFPDAGSEPEYNSIDASLWYVVAVHDYLAAVDGGRPISPGARGRLESAIEAILDGYSRGTRYGIRADADGLLASGAPGVALTWMDARVDGRPVTPRRGKPVEVQALWINALRIAGGFDERWKPLHDRALRSFGERFWNPSESCLFDVVDPDGADGTADPTFRPNQVYAVGGLPFPLLEGVRARFVVDALEARLVTPMGLRSLDPADPRYVGRYEGGPAARDAAYHQGTVWPFLIGAFVEAWLRVHGPRVAAREQARRRFLGTLLAHLDEAGIGHVSEIADGEAPHVPRGCPFQAWSVGELIRAERLLRPDTSE